MSMTWDKAMQFAEEVALASDWTEDSDTPQAHTYTVHMQFSAFNDEHARVISEKFREAIESWHEFVERDLPEGEQVTIQPQGYVVEATHLTDADDWAEHVGGEDYCFMCGKLGGTNRLRVGTGHRWCQPCIERRRSGMTYAIEDMNI